MSSQNSATKFNQTPLPLGHFTKGSQSGDLSGDLEDEKVIYNEIENSQNGIRVDVETHVSRLA